MCTPIFTKLEPTSKISQNTVRTAKEIQTVITSHQIEIKRFHRQMVNSGLTVQYGFIIFQFEIKPDGSVGQIYLIRNNFGNVYADKMMEIIRGWKFKPLETSETQLIELPYAFTDKE